MCGFPLSRFEIEAEPANGSDAAALRAPAPLIGAVGVLRYYLLKILVSAVIIATVSEVSKRSSGVAALIASLPLTSLLAFMWMKFESAPGSEIASLSIQIFWLVIPSLLLFVLLWGLLRHGLAFWPALAISSGSTVVLYFALLPLLRKFGVQL